MKKSVYDLEEKEMTKYIEEFNSTEFGKKTLRSKKKSTTGIIYGLVFIFIFELINIVSNEFTSKNFISPDGLLYFLFTGIVIVGSIFYIYYFTTLKICFYRWLKIKHNIEY